MIELQLSDAHPVETPYLTTRQGFLSRLHDRSRRNQKISQTMFWEYDTLPTDAVTFHRNYLEYLQLCWGSHFGIYVSPDILWYTALTELTGMVAEDSERYRPLFSTSEEKQTLVVHATGTTLPLDMLVDLLREKVPTQSDLFLPSFTTSTDRSRHAMFAAFCDLCSPYYNYMMLACSFPAIRIAGTVEDWDKLAASWRALRMECFQNSPQESWLAQVQEALDACVAKRQDPEHWRDMFKLERCGSGGAQIAKGWYTTMFRKIPSLEKVENFSSSVSVVSYEVANVGPYKMQEGLFFSHQDGIYLIPDFGFAQHAIRKVEPELFTGWDHQLAELRFCERTGQTVL